MYRSACANWYSSTSLFKMCWQCDFSVTLKTGLLPVFPVCLQVMLGRNLIYVPVIRWSSLHHRPPLAQSMPKQTATSICSCLFWAKLRNHRERRGVGLSKEIVTAAFSYPCKYLDTRRAFPNPVISLSRTCLFTALVQGQAVPSGAVKNRMPCN